MKAFFARLFSGEVARLSVQLEQACRERDWYEALWSEADRERKRLTKEVKAEAARNRLREDAFNDKFLKLAINADKMPERARLEEDDRAQLEHPGNIQAPLSEREKDILFDRAKEYTAQTSPNGDKYTAEEVQQNYNKMLADPDNWLSN